MIKWVAAILGYFLFRLPGAILGFFVGSLMDGLGGSRSGPKVFGAPSVSAADFELHLISLCSIVIKADGQVSQRELDYVRQYFVGTYGKDRANAIFRTFNEINRKGELSAQRISAQMVQRTRYAVRLQLLHFLFGIAQADGQVSAAEISKLREISGYLRLSPNDFGSIMAMFVKSADTSYKILEIDKNATNEQLKKAYREMAKKYHPDKVVTQDEAIKRGA